MTNQAGSPSISLKNVDTGEISGRKNTGIFIGKTSDAKNTITVEFNIKNEKAGESKKSINFVVRNKMAEEPNVDAKVGLEIQLKGDAKVDYKVHPTTAAITLVFYWFTTISKV